ncbi:hypothetical protein BDW60DRAFT_64492 [Aspergillus nidulans var. acristatus]
MRWPSGEKANGVDSGRENTPDWDPSHLQPPAANNSTQWTRDSHAEASNELTPRTEEITTERSGQEQGKKKAPCPDAQDPAHRTEKIAAPGTKIGSNTKRVSRQLSRSRGWA